MARDASLPITIRKIGKRYGHVRALDNVDLDISSGEFLTLLGPSGSGKTTLLMVIAGFIRPDHGSLRFGDAEMIRVAPHKRDLGMVFQNYALFPHMDVAANVGFPLRLRGMQRAEAVRKVEWALDLVQLGGYGTRRVDELSGGQRQRVALARAIVFEPRILLMDEPLSALDKQLREHMQIELRRLHETLDMTTVYVTHDQREALTMSDRIAVLNRGRIIQLDAPRSLYERPATRFVAEFIGELTFLPIEQSGGGYGYAGQRLKLPEGAAPHGARLLMVRPERLQMLDTATSADMNLLHGQVEDIVYQGDSVPAAGASRGWQSARGPARLHQRGTGNTAATRRGHHPGTEPGGHHPAGRRQRGRMSDMAGRPFQADLRRDERNERMVLFGLGVPALLVVTVILVIPVAWLFWLSFLDGRGALSLANYQRLVREASYGRILLATFEISAAATVICLVLGYPLAYVLAQLPRRVANLCMLGVLMPFWTSILVRTYAWLVLLQRHGLINDWGIQLGLWHQPLALVYNFNGTLIGLVHIMLPFLVLPVYGSMRAIDLDYVKAAANLGASPTQAFWRVFFPLSLPGVYAGSLMVFILCLGAYVTPEMLGGGKLIMVANGIAKNIQIFFNWGAASALGVVLLVLTGAILWIATRLAGADRLFGGHGT